MDIFNKNVKTADTFLLIAIMTVIVLEVKGFSCNKPQLEITVSPVKKYMQIYWKIETPYPEAWIGLYSSYPNLEHSDRHLEFQQPVQEETGWITTEIVFKKKRLAHDKSTNLGFYAVFWTKEDGKDKAVVLTPYESYPQWMKHYWQYIKDRPINKIFIPGTHDASSYEGLGGKYIPKKRTLEKEESFIQKSKSMFNFMSQSMQRIGFVRDLTITQDQNIQEQLLMGIRYLDIRILKADDGHYYTSHSNYIMEKLDKVIEQVVEFVDRTEKEIVVFDIHDIVSGVKTDTEQLELVKFLKEKLKKGDKRLWVPPFPGITWSTSLEKIYNSGGKIIVAYERDTYQEGNDHSIYWPPVHHYWGNKQNIDDLHLYLTDVLSRREYHDKTLTAVMAELTGNVEKIADDVEDGLNDQAERNAAKIHSWFLEPSFGQITNVLAVDYFRAMGVVRLAFLWNVRMANGAGQCDPQNSVDDKYYEHIMIP